MLLLPILPMKNSKPLDTTAVARPEIIYRKQVLLQL